jgi:hypothetical protein
MFHHSTAFRRSPATSTSEQVRDFSLIRVASRKSQDEFLLPEKIWRQALEIYHDEFVYLKSCKITLSEAVGEFHVPYYPFTHRGILPYVTAPLLMLLVSQLGYALFAAFAAGHLVYPSFPFEHMSAFRRARDDGEILISGLREIKFRKKISLSKPFLISVLPFWEQTFSSSMYVKSKFSVESGAISGEIDTLMRYVDAPSD